MRIFVLLAAILVGFEVLGEALRRSNPGRFEPVVRCDEGHYYRSIWIPGGSLKAVRMGSRRYQRCPVGRHWSWARPVEQSELSEQERTAADAVHDLRIA